MPAHLYVPIKNEPSEKWASLSWDGKTMVFGSSRIGSELGPNNGPPSNDTVPVIRLAEFFSGLAALIRVYPRKSAAQSFCFAENAI